MKAARSDARRALRMALTVWTLGLAMLLSAERVHAKVHIIGFAPPDSLYGVDCLTGVGYPTLGASSVGPSQPSNSYSFTGQFPNKLSGCTPGVATNEYFTITVKAAGKWTPGSGETKESIAFEISGHPKKSRNGKYAVQTALTCKADPWLFGPSGCTVVASSMKSPDGSPLYPVGAFPVTAPLPDAQAAQVKLLAFPVKIKKPLNGQQVTQGISLLVELDKGEVNQDKPVRLEFGPKGNFWAGSGAFSMETAASSFMVAPGKFTQTGTWQINARYAAALSVVAADTRTFEITGGASAGGGGGSGPGSPGGSEGSQAAPGAGGTQVRKVEPLVKDVAPQAAVKPGPPPPVALALRRDPVKLLSSRVGDPGTLALVFQNPSGNEEKPEQAVELRLDGKVVGRGRLVRLAAGRDQRLILPYQLPPGMRGPVQLEVWVGGQKVGDAKP